MIMITQNTDLQETTKYSSVLYMHQEKQLSLRVYNTRRTLACMEHLNQREKKHNRKNLSPRLLVQQDKNGTNSHRSSC